MKCSSHHAASVLCVASRHLLFDRGGVLHARRLRGAVVFLNEACGRREWSRQICRPQISSESSLSIALEYNQIGEASYHHLHLSRLALLSRDWGRRWRAKWRHFVLMRKCKYQWNNYKQYNNDIDAREKKPLILKTMKSGGAFACLEMATTEVAYISDKNAMIWSANVSTAVISFEIVARVFWPEETLEAQLRLVIVAKSAVLAEACENIYAIVLLLINIGLWTSSASSWHVRRTRYHL